MTCKSYDIPKTLIWEAWLHVKANQGAAGIDAETIERFEMKLAANLYKLWNRMSSGSYFPPPVKAVPIPKKSGGVRVLGVPTVSDRIAQTAVKMWLEPRLDPIFHGDSYGYRPGKSALEAIAVTRRRCWDQDWVVEFDIRGLFDNLDHALLMTALRKHCQEPWILLYVERWLKAPMQSAHGQLQARDKGTPQGGVVSPILANLFLHYAFDLWVTRHLPGVRFARYADDAVLHCKSRRQAEYVLNRIRERFRACNLELQLFRQCPARSAVGESRSTRGRWVNYFAVGHSSECFSFVKDWVEKKIKRHMQRARNRQGFGWTRWSREWTYNTLGLFKGYRVVRPALKAVPAG